jgi:histidine triad (HIT) family protein
MSKSVPSTILYQDADVTAFQDSHPVAPVHILVISNRHISTLEEIGSEDATLLGKMILTARDLAETQGLSRSGYRLVINTGPDAGQSVFHLHLHLIGGRSLPFRFED